MAPTRPLALIALFIGFYYLVAHLKLHKTPLIQEALGAPVAALSAYVPIYNQLTDQSTQSSQEALNVVTQSSSKRAPFTRHIVAVGDLHGDMKNAQTVLQFSGVVDEFGNWTGDADFFVQTGDIIDRGDDTIKLFFWMEQLRVQAAATGGVVLSHLGNNDPISARLFAYRADMQGTMKYVYPSEINTFGSVAARQKMLSTGRIGRAWATNYTATSRLPLHSHLGPPNTPFPPEDHALHFQKDDDEDENDSGAIMTRATRYPTPRSPFNLSPFPTKINALSTSFLAKLQNRLQPPPHPPSPYPGLPQGTTREEAELYDANGPFWYRGWATDSEEKACVDVDKVLARTGTRRMIMGHTPDFNNIVSRCNGKIIIIDTGISHAYGGVLSALSIHYTFTPLGDDEDGEQRWTEREIVSALYADRQEMIVEEEREVVGDFRMA
ncbi:Metallo-dependent phosphatase-like protein [Mycena sp. CBHHK59/15]|nr:Metallo-dependent phosphatase-like protein [Mycena sp. CBHHK59/15]